MRLDSGRILALAAGLLAIGTLLGAFGAHALNGRLPAERMGFYTTAVRYHFLHALGLLGIGLAARTMDSPLVSWAAGLLLAGIVLFCGSLYGMSFGAPRALGTVTGAGGISLLAGWTLFACAAWRSRQR